MGMPIITPGSNTCEEAVTNLIESVAMQENALSHILNAEGEKMQAIISMDDITAGQLLCMNRSADQMVNAVARLEMILQAKVELAGQLCSLADCTLTEEEGGGL
ncbi:hypothetical protein [Eisenbergiella sp.]